jgi:glycosyltransferase involved in cell wall biosynthesis
VAQHLELPRSADEVLAALDDIDVLVMTTPDDEGPWAVHDALARGVPAVCFDTHRMAADLHDLGIVVPYLDVAAMADAVLGLHADEVDDEAPGIARRRAELRRRDVSVVGPRIVELATGASA